jgi:membrane associated rhomboid family serine protease
VPFFFVILKNKETESSSMSLSSRSYVNRYTPSNRFPVGVKWLLIVNSVLFVLHWLGPPLSLILRQFALIPAQALMGLRVWQVFTYMFIHADVWNLVWNMLALWMFGAELERTWGTQKFVRFYLTCGVIAGLAVIILTYAFGQESRAIAFGSNGAIYGLLAAYAIVFPDATLLFGFLIPMKSKYFVLIIGALVFFRQFPPSLVDVGLLTGMVAGYLLLRGSKLQSQIRQPLMAGYKDWKLRRARKKFEVYLKRRDSGSDRWVN